MKPVMETMESQVSQMNDDALQLEKEKLSAKLEQIEKEMQKREETKKQNLWNEICTKIFEFEAAYGRIEAKISYGERDIQPAVSNPGCFEVAVDD